jgi:hypothetical protein
MFVGIYGGPTCRGQLCRATTFSIMALSLTTLSMTTLSMTTLSMSRFSIESLSLMGLFAALSINDTQYWVSLCRMSLCWVSWLLKCYAGCCYAECRGPNYVPTWAVCIYIFRHFLSPRPEPLTFGQWGKCSTTVLLPWLAKNCTHKKLASKIAKYNVCEFGWKLLSPRLELYCVLTLVVWKYMIHHNLSPVAIALKQYRSKLPRFFSPYFF